MKYRLKKAALSYRISESNEFIKTINYLYPNENQQITFVRSRRRGAVSCIRFYKEPDPKQFACRKLLLNPA